MVLQYISTMGVMNGKAKHKRRLFAALPGVMAMLSADGCNASRNDMNQQNLWTGVAGVSGLVAVAMGAAAAHAIAGSGMAAVAEKAALYQLIHAAALLFLSDKQGRLLQLTRLSWLLGIILFSGSLYLKAFGLMVSVPAAPIGGALLMVGWLSLIIHSLRKAP